uniref:DUF7045 domain-containing protein n=1 Tax=Timema poppense TaxID=170557 RepID=A0A7R9DB38_TIMPO|nr:unnamed protein product [Timema poppensis]
MFTYTQRRDVGSFECFVGSILSDTEIFIKEAGDHCQRDVDPMQHGMKLTRLGPCFGNHPNTARPAKAHPTNSWHNNKHLSSPEPTKPWKPITGSTPLHVPLRKTLVPVASSTYVPPCAVSEKELKSLAMSSLAMLNLSSSERNNVWEKQIFTFVLSREYHGYKDGVSVGGGRNEKVKLKKLHQHCLENNPLNYGPAREEAREQDHVTGPLAPHMASPEVKSARQSVSFLDLSKMEVEISPLRSLDDFLLESARFQIPNVKDLEKWGKRVVNNLLYYQTNYFLLSIIVFLLVGVMHPTQMLLGMLAVFVAFALFCYFTNAKRSASRFRNNHPYFSMLVVLAGIYFIVYMLGSVIVFIFGILLPVVVTFLHASMRLRNIKNKLVNKIEVIGLKKTPMGVFLETLGLEQEVISFKS